MSQSRRARKCRKRLILHIRNIAKSLMKDLDIDPETTRVVLHRLQHEGVAFASKTLPAYSKYVLLCLEKQHVVDPRSVGMTHFQLKGGAPCFMQGYLFKALAGDPASLLTIRQLCEYFYKTAFSFTDSQLVEAERKYGECDDEVGRFDPSPDAIERVRRTTEELFPGLASLHFYDVFEHDRPRFGPGSFARSNRFPLQYEVLKKAPEQALCFIPSDHSAATGYYRAYPSSKEPLPPTKVTVVDRVAEIRFVPKDSRGPRVISKEPPELIRAQMSFNDFMSSYLESKSRGRILFSDQTTHRNLACEGSVSRSIATIDLKEASDRVSLKVVKGVTANFPAYRWFTRHARSTHCRMPSGNIRRLNKYANMGSGLCFPTLALVVYAVAVTAIRPALGLRKASEEVYVYGDDLIVPTWAADRVYAALEQLGLKVNKDKSFLTGHFRESCGGDYYHGREVGPARLRLSNANLPAVETVRNGCIPIRSDGGIVQINAHCRELVKRGLDRTADYFYRRLAGVIGDLPLVADTCAAIGRISLSEIVPAVSVTAYVPLPISVSSPFPCAYKGIGQSFRSLDGLGDDWNRTPLRRQLRLKRTVVSSSNRCGYGLTTTPSFRT